MLLGGSTASINSALQRGRETLANRYPVGRPPGAPQVPEEPRRHRERRVLLEQGHEAVQIMSVPSLEIAVEELLLCRVRARRCQSYRRRWITLLGGGSVSAANGAGQTLEQVRLLRQRQAMLWSRQIPQLKPDAGNSRLETVPNSSLFAQEPIEETSPPLRLVGGGHA